MNDKISVIIPCYNVEKYIDRCMESILNQTIGLNMLEIILVNDASQDDTLTRLLAYEEKYPELIIVVNCTRNNKEGAARNIGMSYASGDYISFVDADDILALTMLDKMYKIACDYDCEIVECDFQSFTNENEIRETRTGEDFYLEINTIDQRKEFIFRSLVTKVWGRLYKKSFIYENQLNFPEQIYYEDCYFTGLAMLYHKNYYKISETLYFYYQNIHGVTLSNKNIEKIKWEIDVEKMLINEIIRRKLLPPNSRTILL